MSYTLSPACSSFAFLHFYSTLSHTIFTNGKLCNNIKSELVYKFLQKNRKSLNFIQIIKDVLVMSTTKKKLEYKEIDESSELTTEQQESSERSSTLLLEIMRESYYKEMERTNILDNKTGVFKIKQSNDEQEEVNCSHIFVPVDSTKKVLACSKCGFLVKSEELKKNPNFL